MLKNEIIIDGFEYVRKDSIKNEVPVINKDELEYVLIRTYSAGVWAGYLSEIKDQTAILIVSRKIWYWDDTNCLSQLANEGVLNPKNCKFSMEVTKVTLFQVIQILPVSEKAKKSITEALVWKN